MPKIIIREKDLTTNPIIDDTAFAVVVPGFFNNNKSGGNDNPYNKSENIFDDNGIFETNSTTEFVKKVGMVPAAEFEVNNTLIPAHYGNQIAYELLELGYTILYVNLGGVQVDPINYKIVGTSEAKAGYDALTGTTSSLFEPLKDKANYRFRYLVTGLLENNTQANKNILAIASRNEDSTDELENGRGDCIALIDIGDDIFTTVDYTSISKKITYIGEEANKYYNLGGKYAGIFAPSLCLDLPTNKEYLDNNKFPASFYYLACAAYSRNYSNFAEWYAVAGLTRGICKYKVISTTIKLGESAVYALEPRVPQSIGYNDSMEEITLKASLNLIIKIRDNYYLWGNRTAHELTDEDLKASHFLNIRQLCCSIKKDVYDACKKFTFDPNSDVLWVNFCNAIRPTLEAMKADQGIQDYSIIKIEAGRAELKALVRIVPIEAVEDFDITVTLEDSIGTTISE